MDYQLNRQQLTFDTWDVPFDYIVNTTGTVDISQITWSDAYNFWEPVPLRTNSNVNLFKNISTSNLSFDKTRIVNQFKTTKTINKFK
jgi:hypothetical protein